MTTFKITIVVAAAATTKWPPMCACGCAVRWGGSEKQAPAAAPQAPQSALDKWRSMKEKKSKPAEKPARKSPPITMDTIGLTEDDLMRMLMGAGGVR